MASVQAAKEQRFLKRYVGETFETLGKIQIQQLEHEGVMKWKWFDASRITVQIKTRSGTFQTFSISIDSSLNFFWPLNFVRFSCRQVELVVQQNGALSSKLIWQVEPQDPPSMSVFVGLHDFA